FQKSGNPAGSLLDHLPRHAVHAGCTTALVPAEVFPSEGQRSAVMHQIEQVRESLARIAPTPTIQFALHVEDNPGVHRGGRIPVALLPASCIHCLPSPCGRLSRPLTTMETPHQTAAFASRLGHPEGSGGLGPRFRQYPFGCFRVRLYPVWILTNGPCRL